MQQNTDERTKQDVYKNYRKTTTDLHQTPGSGQQINQQQLEQSETWPMKSQDSTYYDQALSMGSTTMTNPSSSTIGSTFQNSGQKLTGLGIESTELEKHEQQQQTENSLVHFYYASEDSNGPIVTDSFDYLPIPPEDSTDIKQKIKPVSSYSDLTPQLIPLFGHEASSTDEINVQKKNR
ncbi:hypothetical protein GE061_011278 [Apolygus lucorum]|uniref:Uncharacterized protein n=1 Tax=Apolygus lucorum TaxID=248454 RepID=A0A8S9XZ52_APOLU|nr:hypothetical protein GE061_011278 [Apolygus lucorum]